MPLDLTVVTPEGVVYQGAVEGIVLPGVEGDFGVLPGHERFLSPLRIGEAEIKESSGKSRYAALSDGFAEVSDDKVTVMAETAELSEDIDLARAERAKEQAERQLEALRRQAEESRDFLLWETALARAITRIRTAQHSL
jgi:F-type H+-transporting ATPase subunit epsilon